MKILSTLFALVLGLSVSSQVVWNSADEPGVGDSTFYYLCDSTVSDYANIKGNGVNWDYSSIRAYSFDVGRKTKAEDAATGPYANFFLNASHDEFIDEHIHTFYKLNGVQRTAYGIQFNDVNLGDVLATYDSIKDRSYPWAFQSAESGSLSNCEIVVYPNSTNPAEERHPANGVFSYECDAVGNISIGDSVISDVLRNYRYDSIRGDFGIFGKATLIRKQYEYFKPGTSFPVFIHSYVKAWGALLSIEYNLVLSLAQPNFLVGIDDIDQETHNFNIYPNPTNGEITINKVQSSPIENVQVLDLSGRIVPVEIENSVNDISVNLNDLQNGVYVVLITTGNGESHSEMIVKTGNN